eukprot:TRINITY_DN1577_c0_g1_i1.p1 TRINITY_DN1577_c0_g1~~TRINITY_DN1577_c0_g1_i1.p1  ORF type:complete len:428 (+),score=106.83 TRINITY_DN1577_c0_g1_i1:239-1522(+)
MQGLKTFAEMEGKKAVESRMSSAAAFVEGGVQDACEDSCSICLEPFADDDPATVTSCKHEYHLQCILEWAQRSKECPMCWQILTLKDPTSQELLEAVEQERSFRSNRSPSSGMFGRTTLEEFEFHHVPVYGDDSDLEERIMQHLAAAAMGRSSYMSRRENHRQRSPAQGHPQFLLFTTRSNASPTSPNSLESPDENSPTSDASDAAANEEPSQQDAVPSSPLQRSARAIRNSGFFMRTPENRSESSSPRGNSVQSPSESQQRSRTSELQSFSEALKSRFSSVSARYKESISRSTRGFREKLLSRNNAVTELGREVQREVSAGVARMMERLDPTNKNVGMSSSASVNMPGSSTGIVPGSTNEGSQDILPSANNGESSSSNITSETVRVLQPSSDKAIFPDDGRSLKTVEGNSSRQSDIHSKDAVSSSV